MNNTRTDWAVMVALLAAVTALAVGSARAGKATGLEAFAFVTGAVCVWLAVKESIWNFPIGLANFAAFSVVYFRAGLLANAALQLVYFVLIAIGWYLWLHGGEDHSRLKVSRASPMELGLLGVASAIGTILLWRLLDADNDRVSLGDALSSAPFWDALTSSLSLASQWLLNRKRLENWLGWIVVDVIYVPLYYLQDLRLTALLYGLFVIMAVIGMRQWRTSWLASRADIEPSTLSQAVAP